MTPPQPTLTPARRLILWSALLTASSLIDLTLTLLALHGLPGARELNPIAALAIEHSFALLFVLKLVAILAVFLAARAIAPTQHARTFERLLIAWCGVYLLVNATSGLQLLGVP